MKRKSNIVKILGVAYHRNGVGGNGFHVVRFTANDDEGNGRYMIGVLFDGAGDVAVLDAELLHEGEIGFGINSWRGDVYEAELRAAVAEYEAERSLV
jgi:hypothetical protein